MFRKALPLALVLAASLTLFAACDSSSPVNNPTEPDNTETVTNSVNNYVPNFDPWHFGDVHNEILRQTDEQLSHDAYFYQDEITAVQRVQRSCELALNLSIDKLQYMDPVNLDDLLVEIPEPGDVTPAQVTQDIGDKFVDNFLKMMEEIWQILLNSPDSTISNDMYNCYRKWDRIFQEGHLRSAQSDLAPAALSLCISSCEFIQQEGYDSSLSFAMGPQPNIWPTIDWREVIIADFYGLLYGDFIGAAVASNRNIVKQIAEQYQNYPWSSYGPN